ncbi:MAG TPA: M28 family peptidase, partial [Lacunisphaera sp.]|nr:M28 family peptidase [Lacunisphaera sp.]
MRLLTRLATTALCAVLFISLLHAAENTSADEQMLRAIYTAALTASPAYEHLRELTTKYPGRLAGSKNLEGAVQWGKSVLEQTGADRIELQPAMVPHWERGPKERVSLLGPGSQHTALTAVALGSSVPTPAGGLVAPVVELHALDELKTADVRGKIVFFNRPMSPENLSTFLAYRDAGDQRNKGPGEAAKYGAVGVLVRSLTLALDDVPHTGNTTYLPDVPRIPAAALSTLAADQLGAVLKTDPTRQIAMEIHSQWFEDAPSHNVIGELRGSEHPEQIILVGGHLDSWDIAPGAHDDGSGVVESIEV